MTNKTKCAASALVMLSCLMAPTGSSQAKNNTYLNFDIHSNQYSKAIMQFDYTGGKYKWNGKGFTMRFSVSGDAGRFNSWLPSLTLRPITMSSSKVMSGKIPTKKRKLSHADSIAFKTSFLNSFAPGFADYCKRNGKSKKLIKDGFFIKFHAIAANNDGKVMKDTVQLPMKIVCMPKPSSPQRTPVALKATSVKLYTIPSKPVCGKPVKLITEIWTNKPGKVEFFLTRNDGAKQKASVTTTKVTNGNVKRWGKTYEFKKSVHRRYQVVLAKQAMTSKWAEIKLNCGAGNDIGRPKAVKN